MLAGIKRVLKEHLILTLALFLTFLVYLKLLFFGHISWDDPEMVFANRAVKEFDLNALLTGHYVGNYHPVTMLLHAMAWLLFKNNNGGHHALNILLHLLNGILVYAVAWRVLSDKKMAGLAAVIFLLHPLQIESVAWISELKNTLSTTFFFASTLFYLKHSENKRQSDYLLALLFFIAGCFSKSAVVILPLTLLCLDIFQKQSLKFSFILNKIPFLIASVIFGIVNLKTQAADLFINYSHAFPYHERLAYAGFALFKYLFMFLCPCQLSVLYPYPPEKLVTFVAGYIVWLAIAYFIFNLIRKKNFPLLALILLCITSLILVLQFIPFGEVLYADRYMYVPVVFFSLLFLFLLKNTKINPDYTSYFLAAILALITFFRMDVWKNSAFLYSDILKKFPDSFVALNSLGAELMMQNQDKEALQYLNKAINVSPQNYKGYYNRGLLLLKTDQPEKAISNFDKAISIYDYHKAYVGRASAYFMLKDLPKAMKDANYALTKDPKQARAYFIIGNCYNTLNQVDSALFNYNKAISMINDDADFYFMRSIANGKRQDFNSCLRDLDRCIDINPLYFEAYYWRGVAKVNLKQDACGDFQVAARNNIEPAIKALNKFCR